MTEESRYTIENAPEPPVPDEEPASTAPAQGEADSTDQPPPAGDAQAGPGPKEAWREVLTQIDALAESMTRWAKTAVNDPENRRHAAEIREKLDAVGSKIGSVVDEATRTDVGRSVAQAADKTGQTIVEVSGKVAQETAPVVAGALTGLAGFLGMAAEKVGKAAEKNAPADSPAQADSVSEQDAAGPDGPGDSANPESEG